MPNQAGIAIGGTFNVIGGSTAGRAEHHLRQYAGRCRAPSPTRQRPGITGSSNTVQGNYIGTTADGLSALPNGTGIGVFAGAANTLSGNLISGNTQAGIDVGGRDTVIQGNTIGLNADGTAALANANSGVRLFGSAINTQVGGSSAGAGNVISGNTGYGVDLDGSSHAVQGNLIGTGPSGTTDLGNGLSGVRGSAAARRITIGGPSRRRAERHLRQ